MNQSANSFIEDSNSKEFSHENDLEQGGWINEVFLTTFGRVVDRGNQKPYTPEMLFQLPKEISLPHCQQVACSDLRESLEHT